MKLPILTLLTFCLARPLLAQTTPPAATPAPPYVAPALPPAEPPY
jgi:hypothetical protein